MWRWRASNDAGKGTLTKVDVKGSSKWGDDITAIGTYLRNVDRGLYNLYVIDAADDLVASGVGVADRGEQVEDGDAFAFGPAGHPCVVSLDLGLAQFEGVPRRVIGGHVARRAGADYREDVRGSECGHHRGVVAPRHCLRDAEADVVGCPAEDADIGGVDDHVGLDAGEHLSGAVAGDSCDALEGYAALRERAQDREPARWG